MSAGSMGGLVAAVDAERIKVTSIRSPLWSAVLAAVLSLGVAALQGISAYGTVELPPESAATGVIVFGVPVLMILSTMMITGEYRTGMIRTTFAATPNRTAVLAAKAVVAAAGAGVVSAVLVVGAVMVARLAADPLVSTRLSLGSPHVWGVAGAVALYAALTAVLGVAVGALLRYTAGAVAVLLLWPLVVEPVVANLPDVGRAVGPLLPFVNAFAFLDVPWLFPAFAMPWDPTGSLIYFAVLVAVVFAGATVTVNRRDA